jgi:RimJ/RimL family protein N-acetyltransferase|tara:strand:- start:222 stop:740 length:519 start_codon:yes stop_codon:yes gene_type:complete
MNNKTNIKLKELTQNLVSDRYIEWMNNYEVTKLTELRFSKHTKKNVINFVNEKKKSKNEYLYGIFYVQNKAIHIGNIKLGPINNYHKYAEISYFIGDLKFHNKGLATKAIEQILILAKKKYKLKKIVATLYSNNIASQKVLEKNKFKLEGRIKKKFIFKNRRLDQLIFGKVF